MRRAFLCRTILPRLRPKRLMSSGPSSSGPTARPCLRLCEKSLKIPASREIEARGSPGSYDENLEAENDSALAAQVAPSTRGKPVNKRIPSEINSWRSSCRGGPCDCQSIGLVEALLEGEGHPVDQLVVQGAGIQ